ncbi:phage regulatory CII family protein [uncultured Paraglaciecola sp.]|uniref:phage regulatory CII family protein n=1 Tax=uncultured Paraglaciecola sp. TaxID=1765024 RepID=UPI00261477DC|nr:phage regulatory CII family protein [uncultured Paraglaciecola sp.]
MTTSLTVTDAAYHTVHDYNGGAVSLAPRVGIASPRVLDNKVNPNSDTHKLTLKEACKIIRLTNDLRILKAMAEEASHLLVPLVPFDGVSDTALLETFTRLMKEFGEFSAVFHDSLADGVITREEIDRLRGELRDVNSAAEEMINRAETLVDD